MEHITEEQLQKLYESVADVFSQKEVDERIEEARAHKAIKKAMIEYLYLRGWLRREAEYRREKTKSQETGQNGRSIEQYRIWRTR